MLAHFLPLNTRSSERINMTSIYIQNANFTLAKKIQECLSDRIMNALLVEDIEENNLATTLANSNTYICSSSWEENLGGQKPLLDMARRLKARTIIIVHEEHQTYKIEKHLGGNLIRFYFKKRDAPCSASKDFHLQLLLSLIQPKDAMTAGDIKSLQLLKLSKKVKSMSQGVLL